MVTSDDIRRNRFHDFVVRLGGSSGTAKSVLVRQRQHAFLFGSNVFGLIGNSETGDGTDRKQSRYREAILELWNAGTLPFYRGGYEAAEGNPNEAALMSAARWCCDNGLTVKGHPLCWHTLCAEWLLEYDTELILERQLDRIRREVSRFAGIIDVWDVINEVVIMPVFDKYDNAVTRICNLLGPVELTLRCFRAAREANPNATLLINDFNLSPDYELLIAQLLDRDCPIDAIGLQSHQHQGYHGAEYTLEVIERFSRFGKPLHFTEATILSGQQVPGHIVDLNDWHREEWPSTSEGEARQAEQVEEYYRTIFAQPQTAALVWWDLVDGSWLNAPAGLLRRDFTQKPAYERLRELIRDEWWIHETELMTDNDGAIRFSGPAGEYEIEIAGQVCRVRLDRDTPEARLV